MNRLAVDYAAALLESTRDEQAVQTVCTMLTGCVPLWDALTNPAVSVREKHAVLARLPELSETPCLMNLLKLLAKHGRVSLLPEITAAFHAQLLSARNAATCVMTCVRTPDEDAQARIKEMLCKLHHKSEILLEIRLDPALLGGFTLEIEGVTYDKSVRGQLNGLSRHLQVRRMV